MQTILNKQAEKKLDITWIHAETCWMLIWFDTHWYDQHSVIIHADMYLNLLISQYCPFQHDMKFQTMLLTISILHYLQMCYF